MFVSNLDQKANEGSCPLICSKTISFVEIVILKREVL